MENKIRAMTLVEVLTVVAILALTVAVATLGLLGVRQFKAERQLHMMAGELSDLRRVAMTERKETSMSFSTDGYTKSVKGREVTFSLYESKLVFTKSETSNGKDRLSFSPSGRPANSGTIYFEIGKRSYGLILSPVNSHIRVERFHEK